MLDNAKDKQSSRNVLLLVVWLFCILVYLMYAPRSHYFEKGRSKTSLLSLFCLFVWGLFYSVTGRV